jgi:hypothetical protein
VLAQNFSESVTSGKLKGSHLFASVIHASRKRDGAHPGKKIG